MIIKDSNNCQQRAWNFEPSKIEEPIALVSACADCDVTLRGAAVLEPNGQWRWCYVRAFIGGKKTGTERYIERSYGRLRFISCVTSVQDFLQELRDSGIRESPGSEPKSFRIGKLEAMVAAERQWSQASQTQQFGCPPNWSIYCMLSATRPSGILVSSESEHPIYMNWHELVSDIGGGTYTSERDNRTSSFNIVVSDVRGKLESVSYKEGGLVIKSEGALLSELVLQVRAGDQNHTFRAQSEVEVPYLTLPSVIQVALVRPPSELVDWGSWNIYSSPSAGSVQSIIQNGENERAEFKPWTSLGHEKASEIVDTVIAMSNGDGTGSLLIGLNNRGIAKWDKRVLRPNFQGSQTEVRRQAIQEYAIELREKLTQRISPEPKLSHEIVEFGGGLLLWIQVFPNSKLTSELDTNNVLVRRGGSNRCPDRVRLARLCRRGTN